MKRAVEIAMGCMISFGIGVAHAAEVTEQSQQSAAKLAAEVCSSCHGPGGRTVSPTFPNLAGQQADYLMNQLKAFRAHTRGEPAAHDFMWGMASPLDDQTIAALAKYFSSQRPAPGKPSDPALIATGKELFDHGVPAKQIPACSSCHGAEAAGNGEFPRLAGHHADYVEKQLFLIQAALRNVPAMHGLIKDLDPNQIAALAAYVQSK